ncbi:MAG: rhomboid family intramembrane serine protease, partial [Halanaerobiales bacterium]
YRLVLNPYLVMQGEVWRLLTYIFIPPTFSPIFLIFVLYFYYMIGMNLENTWGSFKFNVYYLIGIIATTVVTFFTRGTATSFYLNLTLFLAFARLYPNFQILLFFIIPVKIKYLAWLNWAFFLFTILTGPMSQRITIIVALSNYFIFFGQDIINDIKRKKRVQHNRKRFYKKSPVSWGDEAIHKCTVCGITEKDDPKMEFRYCSKCNGAYEYCSKHLNDHEHIK